MSEKHKLISIAVSASTIAGVVFCVVAIVGVWIFLSDAPLVSPVSSIQNKQTVSTTSVKKEGSITSIALAKTTNKKPIVPEISNAAELENSEEMLVEELTGSEKLSNIIENLSQLIEKDGKPLFHPIQGADNDEDYELIRDKMRSAIANDPSLIANLIDLFIENPNSLLSREISAILSETGLPEVQRAALDMGLNQDAYSKDERASALFLVANMDRIDGETRDRLLDSYSREQDSEILQFSLIALKPATSTTDDYARVNETLTKLLVTDDEHVRRHSVYQMAEWATNDDDLSGVRLIALNDPDTNTRARAIMSIGISPIRSNDNKSLLLGVVSGHSEHPFLRKAALNSLNNYSLTDTELASLKEYEIDIDAAIAALKASQ